jgi:putative colanic acid biosynthesis acetyltransferase WcaF
MCRVRLSNYNNSWYRPGRSKLVQIAWFVVGLPILRSAWLPSSGIRRMLLRVFGARVGVGVVVKPGVRVKYPWLLEVGDNSWIGEDVWLDNLGWIRIGSNVCISQGAYLCTGNHDWTDPAFGLVVRPVVVHDGAWIGAKAVLCPGIEVGSCAVASAGSVVSANLDADTIYAGNPAVAIRKRVILPFTNAPGVTTSRRGATSESR